MKASSFCARFSFLFLFTLLLLIPAAAQGDDLQSDLQSLFRKFDLVRIDSGDALRSNGEQKTLTFQADGKSYELVVTPNDLRSRRYRAEDTNGFGMTKLPAPPVTTYKGTIAGEANSEVRLTIDGVRVEGFFENAGRRLFIEHATKY